MKISHYSGFSALLAAFVFSCCFQAHGLEMRTELVAEHVDFVYHNQLSPSDFVEKFAGERSPQEKSEIRKRLSVLKTLPEMIRTENGFDFPGESFPIKVDVTSGIAGVFIINDMKIAIDPKLPLMMQTEILLRKLQEQKEKGKHSFYSFLLPAAEAGVPSMIFGNLNVAKGAVVLALSSKFLDRYGNWFFDNIEKGICFVTVDHGKYNSTPDAIPKDAAWCDDYWQKKQKKLKEHAELGKVSPETDAFKVVMKNSQDGWKFGTINQACPSQSASNTWTGYRGYLRVVYNPKEDKSKKDLPDSQKSDMQEYWVTVYADYDGTKLKGMTIHRNGETEPITYTVDAEGGFTSFFIAAPKEYQDKKFVTENNKLEVPASGDIINPLLKKEQTLQKKIFAFTSSNLSDCIKQVNSAQLANTPSPPPASSHPGGSKPAGAGPASSR